MNAFDVHCFILLMVAWLLCYLSIRRLGPLMLLPWFFVGVYFPDICIWFWRH